MTSIERGPLGAKILNRTPSCKGVGSLIVISTAGGNRPYACYNPVKDGHVKCPEEWPWSNFHRWVREGVYPEHWGCSDRHPRLRFDDIEDTVGE